MKRFFIIMLLIFPLFATAQNETAKAKDILNKLEKKVNSFNSLYIEYNILTDNQQEKTTNRQHGKVTAQKNKFKLQSGNDLEVYCDGVNQWTYMKDIQEVNIQTVDKSGDDFLSDPVKFLTGQRKDFKYFYKGLVKEDGKTFTEIDYTPKNVKAPYSYIRLHIDEKTLTPYSLKYHGRDGVHYTIRLTNYIPNVDISGINFVFDPSQHPDIIINDLR